MYDFTCHILKTSRSRAVLNTRLENTGSEGMQEQRGASEAGEAGGWDGIKRGQGRYGCWKCLSGSSPFFFFPRPSLIRKMPFLPYAEH